MSSQENGTKEGEQADSKKAAGVSGTPQTPPANSDVKARVAPNVPERPLGRRPGIIYFNPANRRLDFADHVSESDDDDLTVAMEVEDLSDDDEEDVAPRLSQNLNHVE